LVFIVFSPISNDSFTVAPVVAIKYFDPTPFDYVGIFCALFIPLVNLSVSSRRRSRWTEFNRRGRR